MKLFLRGSPDRGLQLVTESGQILEGVESLQVAVQGADGGGPALLRVRAVFRIDYLTATLYSQQE